MSTSSVCNPNLALMVLVAASAWIAIECIWLRPIRRRQRKDITIVARPENAQQFQALLSHYCYQDGLHWNTTGALAAIQVATLAGGHAVKDNQVLFISVLLLGYSLTLALYWLIERIKCVRDANEALIIALGEQLHNAWVLRPHPNPVTGDQILRFVIWLLLLADLTYLWMRSIIYPGP